MEQKKSKTPWIVCGVIALVVLCGGAALLIGGAGLLAFIGSETATPTAPAAVQVSTPKPTRTPPPAEKPTVVAGSDTTPGEIAGVPYKSVVQIIAYVKLEGGVKEGWTGSGSIVTKDGLVLTNGHVVLSDRYYQVDHLVVALTTETDQPPTPTYIARLMQVEESLDIAVIRIETDLDGNPVDRAKLNLPVVPMGEDARLNLGDPLVIIGYPGIGGSTITLTRGEVSGFTAEEGHGNRAFIKTSATISGGNSGGLAANDKGQLIGIPTQLGYGGNDQYVDCRVLVDTNRDGVIDDKDSCVPTGGFINALRPLTLAKPLIEAAQRGEVNIEEGVQGEQGQLPSGSENAVIYEDNFDDPGSGWDDSDWDEGSVGYLGGEYQIEVKPEKYLVWSTMELDEPVQDAIISVDTRIVVPTTTGDYGVICRYQDKENFYALEVSEDGYFAIWKLVNDETIMIYDWEQSDLVTPDTPFRIDAACVGNTLLLGINDVLLAKVQDDSFSSGSFGLITGTLDNGSLTIGFDNLKLVKP